MDFKKISTLFLTANLAMGAATFAQVDKEAGEEGVSVSVNGTDGKDGKNGDAEISISSKGIRIGKNELKKKDSRVQFYWGMVDLGLNFLQDKTNYGAGNEQVNKYGVQEDWFDLRNGRSWNVNVYPVMVNLQAVKERKFRMNVYAGIGFQIYNFRYKTSLTHHSDPKDLLTNDVSQKFSKNKLAQNFLSVPLMVNFNHRIDKKNWLTYGFGASIGYNLNTWTKQQSSNLGKVKNHDLYIFNEYNVNLIGEIGVGNVRFYGSYQLTNMYKNVDLVQQPISFGIRFGQI
jgi:hypothetical protein